MKGSLYNYPRLVALMLILIFALGSNAVINMPQLEDPHMRNSVSSIVTLYPGASAERVEALVTEKIELKMREAPDIRRIRSTSRPGISVVTIDLVDGVKDVESGNSRLRDKLREVTNLPPGTSTPSFDDNIMYAYTSIIGLMWEGAEDPNYAILGRQANELNVMLKNLSGTDQVKIYGLPQEEISVTFDDAALAALNLSPQDVAGRIFMADPKNTAGTLTGESGRYVVELDGTLESLERIRSIPLAFNAEGSVTRVGDIAHVSRAFANPPRSLAMVNGKPGVMVAVRMQEDMRVEVWTEAMKEQVANFSALLPAGVSVEILFDQSIYTDERLSGLMGNLIIGAIIVLLVLLVTLGWKASIIAGSILPLATLSALAILYASGFRIQQIVVTGLIVGLGIMVDNAIVVTDSIQTELLKGVRRAVAVSKTIQRLWLPLLGSTTTTVIAFMPILLMPGHAGEFVGGIAAAVIASIIASYVIAFSITSALAGRVLKLGDANQNNETKVTRKWWREGVEGRAISTWFKATLRNALERPVRTMVLAMILPIMGFVLSQNLSEQFFPPGDRDQFHLRITLPASSSIINTKDMVDDVHELFMADERVKSVQWTIGTGAPKFYYNLFGGRENSPNMAEAMVNVIHMNQVDDVIAKFQPLLDEGFPSAQILVRNLEQGPPYSAPIEIRVLGPDLETLRQLGEQVRSQLASIPHVMHTEATLKVGQPKVVVKVNEDEAGIVGLTLRDVADQIRGAIDGEIGSSVIEAVEEVPVRIRVEQQKRDSFNSLSNMQLEPNRGAQSESGSFLGVPLSAIAELQLEPSIGAINRRNGVRVNAIQGFLENNILPDTVFQQLEEKLEQSNMVVPSGYRIEFGGESAERDDAVGKLMSTVGVLFVLMVFAVVLTYDSFRLAGITFAAAFQAAGLGFFSLWLFGYPRGFIVIVGIMGLVGLAINAAIVILSELKSNKLARTGDTDAIVAGVMSTGRHIVSTTLTTVGGFLPLILSSAEFWPPFAVVIAGGTLLSMIVSFFFAPAAFKWFALRRAFEGKKTLLEEQAEAIRLDEERSRKTMPAE